MKKSSHISYHTVQFHETDMAGFAHFPHLFHWAEQAEFEFMQSIGVNLIEIDEGLMKAWPRIQTEAEYIDALRFQDNLAICISIHSIGKHTLTYNIEVFKQEKDAWKLAWRATIKTLHATGDGPGKPMSKAPIPQIILDKLETTPIRPIPPTPSKEF